MNQLTNHITWGLISLQGLLLLIDPEARNHIYNTFSACIFSLIQSTLCPFPSCKASRKTCDTSSP